MLSCTNGFLYLPQKGDYKVSKGRVYLSGRLQGCTVEQAQDWRNRVSSLLGKEHVIIPTWHQNYEGMTDKECLGLVEKDKKQIDESVAVLLNAWSPGWGSGCELYYAYSTNKPIVVVASGDISPWLRVHASRIVPTVEEACRWLRGRFNFNMTNYEGFGPANTYFIPPKMYTGTYSLGDLFKGL